ncbi:MAG: PPC domain-containing DNA-binding protein [Acidobacteriota bacterium]
MRVFVIGERRFLLCLEKGEELMETLRKFAGQKHIRAGMLRGLGAAISADLAFYDLEEKRYVPIPVTEETEVASMIGNLSLAEDGKPVAHVHTSLSCRDGRALGGHIMKLVVGATLEIDLEVLPGALHRKLDPAVRLPLQHAYELPH